MSGIATAVLMCHAPIVVPGIAPPAEASRCERSTRAMRAAAEIVVAVRPEVVVIVSPHAPRDRDGWSIAADAVVGGDFGRFGSPMLGAAVPFASDAASAIADQAR